MALTREEIERCNVLYNRADTTAKCIEALEKPEDKQSNRNKMLLFSLEWLRTQEAAAYAAIGTAVKQHLQSVRQGALKEIDEINADPKTGNDGK